jgi:hypothetical protein
MLRWGHALLLIFSLSARSPQLSLAQEPNALRISSIVVLESTLDPELEATLRELFARNDLVLVHDGVVSLPQTLARVSVEVTASSARVIVSSETDGVTQREVPRPESAALFRETLAHVILSCVEPLRMSKTQRAKPVAPDRAASVAPVAPATEPLRPTTERAPSWAPPSLTLFATAFASAAMPQLEGHPGLGAGLQIGAGLQAGVRFWSAFEGGYVWTEKATLPVATGSAQTFPLRVRLGIAPTIGPVDLLASVHGGADFFAFTAAESPGLVTAPTNRRIQPIAGASFGVGVRLGSEWLWVPSFALDLDLAPRRLVIAEGSTNTTLAQTSRVRAVLSMGLRWNFVQFGGGT